MGASRRVGEARDRPGDRAVRRPRFGLYSLTAAIIDPASASQAVWACRQAKAEACSIWSRASRSWIPAVFRGFVWNLIEVDGRRLPDAQRLRCLRPRALGWPG